MPGRVCSPRIKAIRTRTTTRSRSGTPRSRDDSSRLAAQECGTFRLPPGPFCFVCQHQDVDWIELPGTGTIYTYTVVRHALSPQLAEVVPYVTAVIELDGATGAGSRMIVNVVDCDPESVAIGDRVRIAWDRVSDTLALPRFAPE